MKLSTAKNYIEELGRRGFENLIELYDEEVLESAANCGISPDQVEESYQGKFSSDEEFVEDLLTEIGDLPKLPNYIYIDWERTSRDVMVDYSEDNGHYFRNI